MSNNAGAAGDCDKLAVFTFKTNISPVEAKNDMYTGIPQGIGKKNGMWRRMTNSSILSLVRYSDKTYMRLPLL